MKRHEWPNVKIKHINPRLMSDLIEPVEFPDGLLAATRRIFGKGSARMKELGLENWEVVIIERDGNNA